MVLDAKYCHCSDGCVDLLIAREGHLSETCGLISRYVCGNPMKSKLMTYAKVWLCCVFDSLVQERHHLQSWHERREH